MSNDNGGVPPQWQQPPAYPGAPVPPQQPPAYPGAAPQQPAYPGAAPQQPAYPGAAPQQPPVPGYPGAAPQQPQAPAYPAAAPSTQGYPGATPTAPGYGAPSYIPPYPVMPKSNGLAIASLVCGIAALFLLLIALIPIVGILPFGLGIAAAVMGHVAIRKVQKDSELGGKGLAIAGVITGYVAAALSLLAGAFWIIAIIASAATDSGY